MSAFGGAAPAPRVRILASASNVFARKGFIGGTLNEIAVGAGLTKAGVLHHFASKEAILLGLLTQRDRELDLVDTGGGEDEAPPIALPELIDEILEKIPAILKRRELIELAHVLTAEASFADHPAHGWVRDRHARLRDGFAAAVVESQRRGEVDGSVDSTEFAIRLLALIEGVEAQWLVAEEAIGVRDTLATAFADMLHRARPGTGADR